MASIVGNEPQKYYGEKKVWQALKVGLPGDYIVYHNKEINGYEFDFCIAIPDRGIIVIEVKGWQNKPINIINNTIEIDGIKFKNPKEQARGYRFNLLNKIESQFGVKPLVEDMVCYPFISEEEYKSKRLDIFSAPEFTIFKEDLQDSTKLRKKIDERLLKAGNQVAHAHFDEELFNKFRSLFEANIAVKSNSREHYSILYTIYNLSAKKEEFLVHSYFLGTKEILFFAEEESAKHFVNQINVASKERNIQLVADAIKIGYEKDLEIKNNQLNVFNLQLFVVSNLRDIVSEELEINDGFIDSYEHVLDELQKKCNFNLNQYKLEHADAESNIQVTAGAGTGKTYSMVSRVAYLCNKLSEPITDLVEQLGMVTFTNDATNNMKIRLKQMFENYFVLTKNSYYLKFIEDVDRARISTIHSFIIQILREGSFYTGLGSNFSLTSNEFRRKEIYREYLRKYIEEKDENEDFSGHLPIPTYELIDILIKIANKLQDKSIDLRYLKEENLGRVMDSPMPYFNEFFINVIKPSEQQYLEEARQNNSLSLRECIAYFNQLLESNPEILSKLKLRYLFIDEFQDTDDVQIELLQRIQKCIKTNKVKCKFFVVGDLKQSIYRFRGATMSAFDQLKKNSELSWKEFNLNTNYRTDARLLDIFNYKFESMAKEKKLTYGSNDVIIGVKEFSTDETELFKKVDVHLKEKEKFYDQLFSEIENQIELMKNAGPLKNENERTITLLVRMNWQVEQIIKEANKRELPFAIESDKSGDLFQLASTIDLYNLVIALENSDDPACLLNLIHSNFINLNANFDQLHDNKNKVQEIKKALDAYLVQKYKKTWEDIVNDVANLPVFYVLKDLYDSLEPWKQYSRDFYEQKLYMANYDYLLEKMIRFLNIDTATIVQVSEYLRINIMTKQEQPSRTLQNKDNNSIHVKCMTIHKSKGLEFGTVIMPFMSENLGSIDNLKLEASMSNDQLAYLVRISIDRDNTSIKNSYFEDNREMDEKNSEEMRILYVAMTRAIRSFVYFNDLDHNTYCNWQSFLGG